jgi:hypothetical protein
MRIWMYVPRPLSLPSMQDPVNHLRMPAMTAGPAQVKTNKDLTAETNRLFIRPETVGTNLSESGFLSLLD